MTNCTSHYIDGAIALMELRLIPARGSRAATLLRRRFSAGGRLSTDERQNRAEPIDRDGTRPEIGNQEIFNSRGRKSRRRTMRRDCNPRGRSPAKRAISERRSPGDRFARKF